jgi:hypothetical protein
MAIFRGTGGSGSSSDSTIVDAVTEQAGIATTKRDEAEGFRDEAEGFKNTASSAATTATNKATEANASATSAASDATAASTHETMAGVFRQAAQDQANIALGHANTANSSAVQTVAGSNTQVVGVYNNIANVNTVAGVNTDVTTVAGISSDVTTVAADASDIGTVSTNIANVNNVGNNIANVNAVHGNASNINTVAADGTDIGTVATNIANVNTVAGISSTVTTVAGLESKMDTVIADASDIGAVAGNIGDVTTVAGINADVDTVAGIAAKVTTVADNISDVQAADTNATNAATSASNASASATSASNSATTATTKATEASNSATAASNSATTATTKASQAAGSATTAGTSASTATTKASEASASATTATTKAGEAASSASAASGSATTATTKAAEADASATSAATSATNSSNAASTWNDFYTTYLGAADAQPTVDVQGNAIVAGALYYDTGAGSNTVGLYVYNGSTWVYSTNYNNVTAPYSLAQDLATNSHDISFGDNAKAQFGTSNDLQIYHDGSNSYVSDTGYGNLILRGNSNVQIEGANGENCAIFNENSSVRLFYDNVEKLGTTATGIDVTGTVTASDGFAMGSGDQISSTGNMFIDIDSNNDSTAANLDLTRDGKTKKTARFAENGDISFYEDTGTTAKLFWDASAEKLTIDGSDNASSLATAVTNSVLELNGNSGGSAAAWFGSVSGGGQYVQSSNSAGTTSYDFLINPFGGNVGIGTSSPSTTLDVHSSANGHGLYLAQDNAGYGYHTRLTFQGSNGSGGYNTIASLKAYQEANGTNGYLRFDTNGDTERMRIDSSGNVGIGTISPSSKLHISTANTTERVITESTNASAYVGYRATNGSGYWEMQVDGSNQDLRWLDDGSERMRIDSLGRLGIGTSSPDAKIEIVGSGTTVKVSNSAVSSTNTAIQLGGYAASNNSAYGAHIRTYHNFGVGGASSLVFETSGTQERMRIDSLGRVGIGTTNPTQSLHVNSGATNVVSKFESSDAEAYIQLKETGGSTLIGSISGATTFYSDEAFTERMRIASNGNVGIGTTSPAEKLDINGDSIRIRQSQTPSSATATGTQGQIAWDANYMYVCTSTNTWKRVALATW